jgi:hypothetical protein
VGVTLTGRVISGEDGFIVGYFRERVLPGVGAGPMELRMTTHLTPGTSVSYETTLPVGTTRNRWKPLLEEVWGGPGLPPGVLAGAGAHRRVLADLRKYPKLVGGLSEEGAKRANSSYEARGRRPPVGDHGVRGRHPRAPRWEPFNQKSTKLVDIRWLSVGCMAVA